MRALTLTIAAAALAFSGAALAKDDMTQEQKLAKALEGRVAGEPVDCIQQRNIRSARIYDGIGILYEMTGGTWYLNRPKSGASTLDWTDVMVTDTHSNQLCSIDVVKLIDSSTHMQTGFVGLDKFVPYTKVKK